MTSRRTIVAATHAALISAMLAQSAIGGAPTKSVTGRSSDVKTAHSTNSAEQILTFPADRSMGRLHLLKFTDFTLGSSWIKHHFAEAQGKVKVPADAKVRLELSYTGCEDPSPLLKVNSPALCAMDLRDLENCDDKTMAVVSRVSSLTDVNCAGSDISNSGLASLTALTHLIDLDVQKTLITGDGLVSLQKMPHLERLSIGYLRLTDDSLKYVESLHHLRYLYVPACQLTDKALVHIVKLKSLQTLELFNNQKISDKGMELLATLPNLEYLTLDGTYVDQNAIGSLRKMKSLRSLVMDHKYLKPEQIAAIRKVLPIGCAFRPPKIGGVVGPELLGPLH